ncbi:YaaA family protein [Longibaculum muris]|uniref:YaaA family protein n=1 Tax=Longibaculum muris TaxID=1796628 RepID=UPI00189EF3EB|nr:YaaA family protein [Longibaculum muris]
MKIVIAPSKTMKPQKVDWSLTPILFEKETNYLHQQLSHYNDEQLCELMKISYKQALKVYDYYHQKQASYPALAFFSGTVFKQLELSLYPQHLAYLENLRILCAYYGILKYNTAISYYRLDMTMKPNHINLYEYWYTPIYQHFENEDFIISLASKEFTDMLHHPHVYFIDFIEIEDQKLKRNAMIIKKARGQMLNQMILKEITTLDELKQLQIDGFIYNEAYNQENTLVFTRVIEKRFK